MPLLAQITTYQEVHEERATVRRVLRLNVPASASGDATEALVHNMSERGLLLETKMLLKVGDTIVVDLPQAGATAAEVVWTRDRFAGCEFAAPISKAAISAGLLKSPTEAPPYTIAPSQPLAVKADLDLEPVAFTEEEPWVRALTMGSLLLALTIANMLVVALLSFPFSVG